jgi:hypothetical protein
MKTAAEAKGFIESMNARQRSQRPSFLKKVPGVYVFSLYWHPFDVSLGHNGTFKILALDRENTKQMARGYSDPLVIPGIIAEEYDQLSGKIGLQLWDALPGQIEDPDDPDKTIDDPSQPGVVRDILGLGSSQSGMHAFTTDRTWFGVFVANGLGATKEEQARAERAGCWNFPTKAELERAKDKLIKMMMALYNDAEKKALQGPKGVAEIQSPEREAARYLGLNPDWCRRPTPMGECPECHQPMQPGMFVHFVAQGGCGAVLDEEKVKKNRTPGYEHIWMPKPPAPSAK